MGYVLREYVQGDESGLVELLEIVFDGWPHLDIQCDKKDFWKWRYIDGPYNSRLVAVVTSGEDIIASVQSMIVPIRISGQVILASLPGNISVHPDHRSKGIAKKMIDFFRQHRLNQGILYTYFPTKNPYLIKLHSKLDRVFPHQISNLVKIKDIDKHLKAIPMDNELLMKLGYQALKTSSKLLNIIKPSKVADENLTLIKVDKFDKRFDSFWRKIKSSYDFIIDRNIDYMNWRFCDQRAGDYRITFAYEGEKPVGYSIIIVNRFLQDYPIGYIVDLLSLEDRLDVVEVLLLEAESYFERENVNIILTALFHNHPYKRVLGKRGFLDSRTNMTLFYNYQGEDKRDILEKTEIAQSVHFMYGDIDSLPVNINPHGE